MLRENLGVCCPAQSGIIYSRLLCLVRSWISARTEMTEPVWATSPSAWTSSLKHIWRNYVPGHPNLTSKWQLLWEPMTWSVPVTALLFFQKSPWFGHERCFGLDFLWYETCSLCAYLESIGEVLDFKDQHTCSEILQGWQGTIAPGSNVKTKCSNITLSESSLHKCSRGSKFQLELHQDTKKNIKILL